MLAPLEGTALKPGSKFSDTERNEIISQCISSGIPAVAKSNNVDPCNIYKWAKKAGVKIPSVKVQKDEKTKKEIIKQCASGKYSPAELAEATGVAAVTIRRWAKNRREILPGKYSSKLGRKKVIPSSTVTSVPITVSWVVTFPTQDSKLFIVPYSSIFKKKMMCFLT